MTRDEASEVMMTRNGDGEERFYDPRYCADFEEHYRRNPKKGTIRGRCNTWIKKSCSKKAIKKSLIGNFPFVKIMRGYRILRDLPNDVIAGMTVGIMQIPQGMAYAALASLPPICGLYTSLFGPLVYFFLGSSKHASMGTIAVVSLMIAAVLDTRLASDDIISNMTLNLTKNLNGTDIDLEQERFINARKIQIATALTFVSGLVMMVLGKIGFGLVATYMSINARKIQIATALTFVSGLVMMVLGKIGFGLVATYMSINARKIQIATALTFVSGLVMMVLGKIGLGFVTTYMSAYLISGFTTGVAVHVVSSQMKNILGLSVKRFNGVFKVIKTWIEIFKNIGDTNWVPVVTSLVSMVTIYVIKTQINERFKHKLRIPIPIELIVVILGTAVSHFGQFKANFDVKVVGEIPAGIPLPQIPDVSLVTAHIGDAIIIGVIAFAQSVSMAKTLAMRNKYSVNANQEMFAYGAGSVLCAIFSGYITAASVARSVVQEGAGGITQIAGLAGCVVVLVVVLAVGPLFYSLPSCVLSSVIFVNLRSMFRQTLQLPDLWRKSVWDFSIWVVTFLCVVLLDADVGLGIGIIFSVFTVVCRTQKSGFVSKGEVDTTGEYRSYRRYDRVKLQPSVKILTFESPLYFANSELFVNKSYKESGVDPIELKRKRTVTISPKKNEGAKVTGEGDIQASNTNGKTKNGFSTDSASVDGSSLDLKYLVFDMTGVTFIDTMGERALELAVTEFESIDIDVFIVGLREEVMDILEYTGFMEKHRTRMFIKLCDAVTTIDRLISESQL